MLQRYISFLVILAASLLLCGPVYADEEKSERWAEIDPYLDALVTDRPDISETSYTVGKLRLQIETSFEFIQSEMNGVTTRDYVFPTLFRFGIIDPLEFRVATGIYYIRTETGRRYQHGATDTAFGFKWHFLDAGTGGVPSMALLAEVLAPSGRGEFSNGAWTPLVKLLFDWELPYNFDFGVNLGFDVPGRDDVGDKYAQFIYSAALNYTVHGTNNRFRIFIEVAGVSPVESNKPDIRLLSAGLAFLITPNVQVDGYARVGITPSSPDFTGGVGWAFRFF